MVGGYAVGSTRTWKHRTRKASNMDGTLHEPDKTTGTGKLDKKAATILVIEDEDAVREVLKMTLERSGFSVLAANGGNEALDMCEMSNQPIDLVLTDIVMPGTSGTDLAAYLAVRYSSSQVDNRKVGKLAMAIQVAFQELGVFQASGTAVPLQPDVPSRPIPFRCWKMSSRRPASDALCHPRRESWAGRQKMAPSQISSSNWRKRWLRNCSRRT